MMLAALSTYHAGMPQLVIVGDGADARALLAVARERYRPNAVVDSRRTGARATRWRGCCPGPPR